jgi:hypothetical protein
MSLREIPGQLEAGEFGAYVVLSATGAAVTPKR